MPPMPPVPFDCEALLARHGGALRALARTLLRDAHDADDAVQETWARALRSPPRHGARLDAWCARVLRNVVRRLRRGERRRRRHELGAANVHASPAGAAADAGPQRSETTRRLLAAIDALDPPYRDIVWQRWFEGRTPRAIAAAAHVPVATVKSRLQRALGMLRARLGKDGAAWRGALAAAFAGSGPEAAAAAAGAVTMATAMGTKLAALGVALGLLGAWWMAARVPPPAAHDANARADAFANVGATRPEPVPVDPAAGTAQRTEAPDAPATPTPAPSLRTTPAAPARLAGVVRGRAVDADTLQPLDGVDVLLWRGRPAPSPDTTAAAEPAARDATGAAVPARAAGRDQPVARTAADGTFALAVEGESHGQLGSCDRVAVDWDAAAPRLPGGVVALGDVPLRRGRIVRGHLVDERGAGVAIPPPPAVAADDHSPAALAAHLRAFRLSVWYPPVLASTLREMPPQITVDANGTFATARPVPLGPTQWSVSGPFELVSPGNAAIGAVEPAELVLSLRPRARIRGRVVDDAGAPIAGVGIATQRTAFSLWATDADGGFTLLRLGDEPGAVTHLHVAQAPGFEPPPPLPDVAWGRDDVQFVLRRLVPFAIEVVGEGGVPIESFGVAVARIGEGMRTAPVEQRSHHPGGRLAVDGVVRGRCRLRVLPVDPAWAPSGVLDADGEGPLRVELRARPALDVEVHRNGEPIANVHVALLREHAEPGSAGAPGDLQAPAEWLHGAGTPALAAWFHGPGAEPIAQGHTDAAGRARLRRDDDLEGCALYLRAEGAPAAVLRRLTLPADGGALRIGLPGHGTIVGRLHASREGAPPMQIAVPTAGLVLGNTVPVGTDGTFRIAGLQAGRHRLQPLWRCQRGPAVVLDAVLDVDVRADEVTAVELRIGDPTASVRGRVLADGPLPEGLTVEFVRLVAGGTSQLLASAAVDAGGALAPVELLPGEYRVGFRVAARGPAATPGLLREPFVFAAGEDRELVLRYVPRRLVVQLRHADGNTVRHERVTTRCAGVEWGRSSILVQPIDDHIVLDPAPLLPVELRGSDVDAPWSTPVAMPDGVAEHEVTVVLPASAR
jgi:RNA polymerase sigma factor (sigma-70 family)